MKCYRFLNRHEIRRDLIKIPAGMGFIVEIGHFFIEENGQKYIKFCLNEEKIKKNKEK